MTRRLTAVTGPPGTGKTRLVVDAVATAVAAGQRVLVAAASDRAVDEIVERCRRIVPGLLMRAGHPRGRDAEAGALDELLALPRPARRRRDQGHGVPLRRAPGGLRGGRAARRRRPRGRAAGAGPGPHGRARAARAHRRGADPPARARAGGNGPASWPGRSCSASCAGAASCTASDLPPGPGPHARDLRRAGARSTTPSSAGAAAGEAARAAIADTRAARRAGHRAAAAGAGLRPSC